MCPCSYSPQVGLYWVPGKGKKASAWWVSGGEQLGTGDCPGLVGGAGNNSWAFLTEYSFNMSQNGYLEDAGEYLWGGVWRELLGQKSLGDLVPPAEYPWH